MKKSIYRFILYPARQLYRFIVQPRTRGVKAIIIYKNQILLIKNTYGDRRWNVPGGGVNNDESLEDAIRREVYEEVGIKVEKITPIGTFQNIHEYKYDTVTVYKMSVQNKTVTIDNSEIESYQWFELSNLPAQQTCTKTLLNILEYLY